jgi:hypothetical protein
VRILKRLSNVSDGHDPRLLLSSGAAAWARISVVALVLALIPNNPHPAWYALPEAMCDMVTSDEDQWRCDMEPVTWQRHTVPRISGR